MAATRNGILVFKLQILKLKTFVTYLCIQMNYRCISEARGFF